MKGFFALDSSPLAVPIINEIQMACEDLLKEVEGLKIDLWRGN